MKTQNVFAGVLASLTLAVVSTASHAAIVIPITGGQASGSNYFVWESAMDSQPVTVPIEGTLPLFDLGAAPGTFHTSDQGYIDFGTGYADIEITEIWTAYWAYSTYDGSTPFTSLWWSSSTDNLYDGGDVLETGFNFAVKPIGYGGEVVTWAQDFSGLSIVPKERYLIVNWAEETGQFGNGRVTEIAVVGNVVPEPASLGLLLGAASVGLFQRRRLRRA